MKHKRFSDEVDDICRRHAISAAPFHTWRKKYGGMEASDVKRRREPRRRTPT